MSLSAQNRPTPFNKPKNGNLPQWPAKAHKVSPFPTSSLTVPAILPFPASNKPNSFLQHLTKIYRACQVCSRHCSELQEHSRKREEARAPVSERLSRVTTLPEHRPGIAQGAAQRRPGARRLLRRPPHRSLGGAAQTPGGPAGPDPGPRPGAAHSPRHGRAPPPPPPRGSR